MPFRKRNPLEDVYHVMGGTLGTVLCFHGTGGSGFAWANTATDKGRFAAEMVDQGFSIICPTAKDEMWNALNMSGNRDIQAVNKVIKELDAVRPFFLVGHSNGGGFVTRFALYGDVRPVAVQFSNSAGNDTVIKNKNFRPACRWCYSPNDPGVEVQKVYDSMAAARKRGLVVNDRNLSAEYAAGDYKHEHEFVNTAEETGEWFLSMEEARE
jgi:pimeloyl-ACP methyl ester carboxylesterase